MAVKLVVLVLAALTIASASSERTKRQSGAPDFSEYFNKFQEHMKPISSQFPSLPKPPSGFGNLPSFGGSSGSQYKREVNPYVSPEIISQFLGGFSNFPFKPPQFGQQPQTGSPSGSGIPPSNEEA